MLLQMKQEKPKKLGRKKKPAVKKWVHMTFRADPETKSILGYYTGKRLMVRSKAINELIKKAHAQGGI